MKCPRIEKFYSQVFAQISIARRVCSMFSITFTLSRQMTAIIISYWILNTFFQSSLLSHSNVNVIEQQLHDAFNVIQLQHKTNNDRIHLIFIFFDLIDSRIHFNWYNLNWFISSNRIFLRRFRIILISAISAISATTNSHSFVCVSSMLRGAHFRWKENVFCPNFKKQNL